MKIFPRNGVPAFFTVMIAALACILALPVQSFSQQATSEDGPSNFQYVIIPEAGETYDSNITFSRDKVWDLITELALGVGVRHEGKKHLLKLFGLDRQQIFSRNGKYTNNAQYADLFFRYALSKRDSFTVRDHFAHAEEPRTFEEALGRASGRFDHIRNEFQTDYTRKLTRQFSVALRYGNRFDLLSSEEFPDSLRNRGGVDFNYSISSKTRLTAFYEFNYIDFRRASDAKIHSIAGRLRQYLTRRIYLEPTGGIDIVDSFSNETFVRPLAAATLAGELDKKTQIKATFELGTDVNPFSVDIFQYLQTSVGFSRELWNKMALEAKGFYGHGKFRDASVVDDYGGAFGELTYDLPKDFKIKLAYTFTILDSISSRKYDKQTVTLKLARVF
ncbi:MAG: hypothetical protein HY586_07410 [Candidatus Omnitrophica bacterium]|nr:hypothetical protein [Candidatus Omnitrophota bacterium]